MDGIHDLGGKQGFGPVNVDDGGVVFHHDWEGREWGIAQSMRTPGITIDWWRHCRELIMPEDYLSRPYFDSWAQTDFSTYIEAGWISMEEVDARRSLQKNENYDGPAPVMTLEQVLDEDRAHAYRFDGKIDASPRFNVGQKVRSARFGHGGHTRLPQYARGRIGTIQVYHGAHVFPDLSAQGEETFQPLYSVMFEAAKLWPEAKCRRDKVYLDMWESYLDEV